MKKILIQLDTDPHPSSFDAVVALDAGADHLLPYGSVTPDNVVSLVHGAMFTRGPDVLKRTAIFIGGRDAAAAESLLSRVSGTFFGPIRVSVMLDANGCNSTAAAAVLGAARHLELAGTQALVLGSTGPVGRRVARLLAREGAAVRAGSRSIERADAVCQEVREAVDAANISPCLAGSPEEVARALEGIELVVSAGALGVQLLPAELRCACQCLKVAIDLNAVPPAGIEGLEITDKAVERDGVITYGAIGVGGTKMKIHKAAIAHLFEANDRILDAEEILELAKSLE